MKVIGYLNKLVGNNDESNQDDSAEEEPPVEIEI